MFAVTYPEFTRYTYKWDEKKFAIVGRMFNSELDNVSDEEAAEQCCIEIDNFLKKIDLWISFKDLNVSMEDIRKIADVGQILSDYKNNPHIATVEEMYEILVKCIKR